MPSTEKVTLPTAPSKATLANPELTYASSAMGGALITYDPDRRCGAVYFHLAEMWRIYSPIRPDEFRRCVQEQGFEFPNEDVATRWSQAVGTDSIQ